jgi:5'-nucleotidase
MLTRLAIGFLLVSGALAGWVATGRTGCFSPQPPVGAAVVVFPQPSASPTAVVVRPTATPPALVASGPSPTPTPEAAPPVVTYTVKRGDTLWDLARTFYGDGRKWRRIAQANPICNPRRLQIGTVLRIP